MFKTNCGHIYFFVILQILLQKAANYKKKIFTNILALSIPDDGYSRNVSCTLNLICTFLL